jgi:dGTPase
MLAGGQLPVRSRTFVQPYTGRSTLLSTSVRRRLELREESLSPYAARSRDGLRDRPEEPDALRGEFQRDRDRIIHSLSFRRLKHKTQVFIAPASDHYVTRLTHTLEVAQISRTIARALNLNEDLAEAIALGHDIGHTPFGHVGEKLLDTLDLAGFSHAEQSLRTVEKLEKQGRGLNLTQQVRQGIVSHSKPRGDVLGDAVPKGLSLEGQICRISDAVAYLNHDLADAFRAGTLREEDLPDIAMKTLGDRHSLRIHTMVTDIVESSWAATGEIADKEPSIEMSPGVLDAVNTLRDFMFERVYVPSDLGEEGQAARDIVGLLYRHLHENPDQVPEEYRHTDRPVVDYIAGMTDHFAMRVAEQIQPDIAAVFRMARP